MFFKEEEFEMVESATLNGGRFNENQRRFIELLESKYIIAGPGVGKTTCLSAKIVLLLLEIMNNSSNEAICIITKTNVAVDEINRILKNMGLSKIKHPHFVGTVHQFFNTFLATPYIKEYLNPKNFRFDNEKEYSAIIKGLMKKSSYFSKWPEGAQDATRVRIEDSKLVYDESLKKIILSNTTNWDKFDKYANHMFDIKWKLKGLGFFGFEDIFLFSQAAMNNSRNISLLRKRFKYIFIDEFQDTEVSNINLINRLFADQVNILQYIGDPNQTLDFDGEIPRVEGKKIFELNICNRFGENIGNHLPNIIKGVNLKCLEVNYSFNPLLLLYKSKTDLIPYYEAMFSKYLSDAKFAGDKRKDTILAIQNNTILDFQRTDSESSTTGGYKIKANESFTAHIIKIINDTLYKKLAEAGINDSSIKEWIKVHLLQLEIKKCLVKSIKNGTLDIKSINSILNVILEEKCSQKIYSTNDVFNTISAIIKQMKGDASSVKGENKFKFSTIHSAKGETHRSVLLIDSEKDKNPKIHTRMLKSFYCEDNEDFKESWVQRNLLYVAMSRPTRLFAFGMDQSCLNEEEVEMFKSKGWDVEYTYPVDEKFAEKAFALNL
ncbi:UvrD-helicase domain-containing protein [Paenibacillus sp. LjRoot153]|uniref:UvrD-helicase domain-containing protein n=1 Tax=Paenibacillus sp. LjRoot153 TaxID=3342270 RepID=UPI003ED02F80